MFNFLKKDKQQAPPSHCARATASSSSPKPGNRRGKKSKSKSVAGLSSSTVQPVASTTLAKGSVDNIRHSRSVPDALHEAYDAFDNGDIPKFVTKKEYSQSTIKTSVGSSNTAASAAGGDDEASSIGNDDVASVGNINKCPFHNNQQQHQNEGSSTTTGDDDDDNNDPSIIQRTPSTPSLNITENGEEWDHFTLENNSGTNLGISFDNEMVSNNNNTMSRSPTRRRSTLTVESSIGGISNLFNLKDASENNDSGKNLGGMSLHSRSGSNEISSSGSSNNNSYSKPIPSPSPGTRRGSTMTMDSSKCSRRRSTMESSIGGMSNLSRDAATRQSMSMRFLESQAKSLETLDHSFDNACRGHRDASLGTNNSGNCPFFVGAADTNAHLLMSMSNVDVDGKSCCGFYETRLDLVEEQDQNGNLTLREEAVVHFDYSRVNPEFPKPIKEEELFGNPTSGGYMSREHGFLVPDYEKSLKDLLESKGRMWYSMGKRMEGLMASNRLLAAIDGMCIIEGDELACPDGSLQIAAGLLAYLTYGYRAACWRNKITYVPCPSLHIPFKRISERLGRKDVYFAPEDFMYNQRPIRGNRFEFDNLEIMSPLYGTAAESLMSKLFCESNRHLYQMQDSILALCRGEWKARHIHKLITEVKLLTRMFGKAIPDTSAGKSSIDPVEFATAFANATAPFKEGVPALSGAGCPVFVVLDLIIGRKNWNSAMGKDTLMQVVWMPLNWRRYIEYIRQARLFEKVPTELQYLWQLLKEVFCGERGWLGKHKYRAYQFVELAGALGRTSNKGSSSGANTIEMLEESRRERDSTISDDRSSYKMCNFGGIIKSVKRVSEDRSTKLVTIQSNYSLSMQEGDHVAVVMKNNDDHIWRFSAEKGLILDQELSLENGTLSEEWRDRLDYENLEHKVYNVLMCGKLRVAEKLEVEVTVNNLCSILHPEEPRLYSFATVNPSSRSTDGCVTEFDLLVTRTGPGGCSAFLFESVGHEVSFGLSTAVKCDLPTVKTQPLVIIAAGSGLGTYLPLLVNQDLDNPKYAFLAFRSRNTVPHLYTHLKNEVSYGKLNLFVELSREETTVVSENRILKNRKTKKRYIDKLLKEEADLIRELAAPLDYGGMEASFFICGNNDFFKTVRCALDEIDHDLVSKLVRSNRLQLEVQARGGLDGKCNSKPLKLTETCFHNKLDDYWTIIDGIVYDFTEYLPWHPGGRKILHYVAGTDCTEFWELVSHSRDRMVYSQISAYEIGPFDSSDPDGLMGFLELVTRCENCVELYMAKEDLFSNLCDSYDKVINVVESIFGEVFVELVCRLVSDREARGRMLNRIYLTRQGIPKIIAKRLFSVAPKIKGLRSRTQKSVTGDVTLRPVSDLERSELQTRLISSGKHFFCVCKRTIVDYCHSDDSSKDCKLQTSLIRMFFGLVQAIESLFVSLSQPIPIPRLRKWDVMKAEVLSRKTFVLRFNPQIVRVSDEIKKLTRREFPDNDADRDHFIDAVLSTFDVAPPVEYQDDSMMLGSNVIEEWFSQTEVRDMFKRLDTNCDGLVSRSEIDACKPQNIIEVQMLNAVKEDLKEQPDIETYNYEEFLLCSPALAEKKRTIRVSNLLFRGMMMAKT